ncbi:MAG: hypothetical protein ACK5MV_00235 [Aminipila sp.]
MASISNLKYRDLKIIKHALQMYVGREGATRKDKRQEKNTLAKALEEIEKFEEKNHIRS